MTDVLRTRFLAHAREAGLFPRPGLALLAVSGGPDSVAMLDLFVQASAELGLTLAVAHVDHGISENSGDVAEQVLGLAMRLGVPAYLETLSLGAGASETTARRERYRALRRLQRKIGAAYLVTAHHADDQVETVLYRVFRGSAPAGLAGIQALGPHGLTRPLLPFHRTELRAWLGSRLPAPGSPLPAPGSRLPVYDDPANADARHDRSWLRHDVLPLLRERFSGRLDSQVLRLQRSAREERNAWHAALRSLPELDFRVENGAPTVACASIATYDKTLSVALLRALGREAGVVIGPVRAGRVVEFAARAHSGQRVELGRGWMAAVDFGRLRIVRKESGAPSATTWGTDEQGHAAWEGWTIEWRTDRAGESTRSGFTTWVPVTSGQVRAPISGDRIEPLGGIGSRPLRRVLMEARIPRDERSRYPVLVTSGRVVWVPGVCRAGVDVPRPGTAALRLDVRQR